MTSRLSLSIMYIPFWAQAGSSALVCSTPHTMAPTHCPESKWRISASSYDPVPKIPLENEKNIFYILRDQIPSNTVDPKKFGGADTYTPLHVHQMRITCSRCPCCARRPNKSSHRNYSPTKCPHFENDQPFHCICEMYCRKFIDLVAVKRGGKCSKGVFVQRWLL